MGLYRDNGKENGNYYLEPGGTVEYCLETTENQMEKELEDDMENWDCIGDLKETFYHHGPRCLVREYLSLRVQGPK